jgi:hypothetical protein
VAVYHMRTKKNLGKQDVPTGKERTMPDEYKFEWHEIGQDNPFNKRILDVRSLTWSVVATTRSKAIAEKYNELRRSDGRYLIGTEPADFASVDCDLRYPNNGEKPEGIVFKADSMDVKWDIYIYSNIFYFARSWAGELGYKGYADVSEKEVRIRRIDYARIPGMDDDPGLAIEDVHFLVMTHAMKRVYPHPIPKSVPDDPKQIALYSFSMFGNKACYATRDGILDVTVSTNAAPKATKE